MKQKMTNFRQICNMINITIKKLHGSNGKMNLDVNLEIKMENSHPLLQVLKVENYTFKSFTGLEEQMEL